MERLYERFRPRVWAEVVGQDKAVRVLSGIEERGGFGGHSVWVSGPTGSGKTTPARIIARTLADDWFITEFDSADDFGADAIERMRDAMGMYGGGKGGRAWIVNEAHGLRADSIRKLLGILERLPRHCVVIFTTTKDGEEALFDGIDSNPLLSRCIRVSLTNQGFAEAIARRVRVCAIEAGLDGRPEAEYVKLARKCRNNARAMFEAVESGEMSG